MSDNKGINNSNTSLMNTSTASASSPAAMASRGAAPLPTFRTMFWNDGIFKRAVNAAGFALMWAVGIWWVTRPIPNPAVQLDRGFEEDVGAVVPPIAAAICAVAVIIAIWRWFYVRKMFTEGTVVQGKILKLKCEKWQTSANVDQSHGSKSETRYSYYMAFSYTVNGQERTLQRKLPSSGFSFGLHEGGPVELVVHESKPDKPLIRPLYLNRR